MCFSLCLLYKSEAKTGRKKESNWQRKNTVRVSVWKNSGGSSVITMTTLTHKLVYPKDKVTREKLSSSVQRRIPHWRNQTTATHKPVSEQGEPAPADQGSAVLVHIKEKRHTAEDNKVNLGVKEAMYVEVVDSDLIFLQHTMQS